MTHAEKYQARLEAAYAREAALRATRRTLVDMMDRYPSTAGKDKELLRLSRKLESHAASTHQWLKDHGGY